MSTTTHPNARRALRQRRRLYRQMDADPTGRLREIIIADALSHDLLWGTRSATGVLLFGPQQPHKPHDLVWASTEPVYSLPPPPAGA